MKLFFNLCSIFLSLTLSHMLVAAETSPSAAERADQLIKELEAKRLDLDDAARADLALIDLLTRKAEAYILVDQPADAGRMLVDAQTKIAAYKDDQRDSMNKALKGYSARLYVVAQLVLDHTANLDLGEKRTEHTEAQKPSEDPAKTSPKTVDTDTNTDSE